MAKKKNASRNAKKENVKTPVTPVTAEAPVTPETTVVEKPEEKPEEVKTPQVENPPVEAPAQPPKEKKQDPPKKGKEKPTPVITPEVVEKEEKPKEDTSAAPTVPAKKVERAGTVGIGEGLYNIAKENGDRMDHNSAVKLLDLFKNEFMDDPKLNTQQKEVLRKQYRGIMIAELLCYSAQVSQDMQTFGARVTTDVFKVLEKEADELFGIKLIGRIDPKNDGQTVIDFDKSDIPAEVKAAAVADNKAKTLEIPEPSTDMPIEEKITAIRTLMSQKLGMGGNLISALNWGKKAFGLNNPAQVLATIYDNLKVRDILCLNGIERAVYGKFFSEHCILSAHALLKGWLPSYNDQDISNLVRVFLSRNVEKIVDGYNSTSPAPATPITFEGELAIRNSRIQASLAEEVISGILNKKDVVAKKVDLADETLISGDKCYKSLISAYGESDSIIKDKVAELVKYYVKPIDRLANYKDESAYSEAPAK